MFFLQCPGQVSRNFFLFKSCLIYNISKYHDNFLLFLEFTRINKNRFVRDCQNDTQSPGNQALESYCDTFGIVTQSSQSNFLPIFQSPTPYNNVGNILQNQLQAPRVTTNKFQQQPQSNQIYTPNIIQATAQFTNGNNTIGPTT